jgi:hypothetical protein
MNLDRNPLDGRLLRPPYIRSAVYVIATILVVPVLWFVLSEILGVSKGLGFTDEGLHLLAADPPSNTASWGFPFGWHTRPLFAVVGYDIAAFRTLGALILVLTSVALGWSVSYVFNSACSRPSRLLIITSIGTAVFGSLFYYIAMARTPSYNWLNLVGIQIAISAILVSLVRAQSSHNPIKGWKQYLLSLVTAFGLFLTIPAKPSTLPIFMLLGALSFLFCFGVRPALIWIFVVALITTAFVGAAVILRVWPLNFVEVFSLATRMPVGESQTSMGALVNLLRFPNESLGFIAGLTKWQLIFAAVSIILMLIPIFTRKRWIAVRLIGFTLAVATAISISGVMVPLMSTKEYVASWPAPERTVAGSLVLFSAVLVTGFPQSVQGLQRSVRLRVQVVSIALLASAPFLFAFGSDIGILKQSGVVAGFLFLSTLAVLAFGLRDKLAPYYWLLITFATVAIASSGLTAGWKTPYDTPALNTQVVETFVGSRGAVLQLAPDVNASLNLIRSQAISSGWRAGMPLIDITYAWHPGIPNFLGASVPESLMMTILGSRQSQEIFDFHLTQAAFQHYPFRQAWLLTPNPNLLAESGTRSVLAATEALSKYTQRDFPKDYDCINAGQFRLWRPLEGLEKLGQQCNP